MRSKAADKLLQEASAFGVTSFSYEQQQAHLRGAPHLAKPNAAGGGEAKCGRRRRSQMRQEAAKPNAAGGGEAASPFALPAKRAARRRAFSALC